MHQAEELKELEQLKQKNEAPEWMTAAGYITISKGYRLKGETPRGMYMRVAVSAADFLYQNKSINKILDLTKDQMADAFFQAMWKNWLCPASPVLSNLGTDRGLPISCYGNDVGDSVQRIMECAAELAMLSKNSGGVGMNWSRIRPRGTLIKGGANGTSEGIIPFAKIYDSTIIGISQGSTRRGAASGNLNIEHGDWHEFVRMRRPEGDINRQCGNLHHCTVINDDFMQKVVDGDYAARAKWAELMKARMETGEPYIMFKDNVNKTNPAGYKSLELEIDMTNICSEITLFTDDDHSFICCLASLNLVNYDEWKTERIRNLSLPQIATFFLNGVLNEFIGKARSIFGLDKVVRHAIKGRAIGIGVLGWHTLLQAKSMPFESFPTMMLNGEIFNFIHKEAVQGSKDMGRIFGEPEWCKGTGMYNSHLIAIAPTRSNSIISGDVSPGIEPIIANAYVDKTAKGTFIRKNPYLMILLEKYEKNDDKIWKDIARKNGSVQHLDFLSDNEKNVFKTAYEINQMAIVTQAAQRQQFVCQSQSLNLFFPTEVKPSYFNNVHIEAWKMGIKTLYYCRSKSGIQADIANRDEGCLSCES
jgi:ribonucleoside-diphosphate reductase alpha chain